MTRSEPAAGPPELSDYASKVLDVADSIPSGRVMSYGDVAEYLGEGGPRQVGRVMSLWGGGVPWWRVVHSDGTFLSGHEREAIRHYRAEGTPLRLDADGRAAKLNMRLARWRSGEPGAWDRTPHNARLACQISRELQVPGQVASTLPVSSAGMPYDDAKRLPHVPPGSTPCSSRRATPA